MHTIKTLSPDAQLLVSQNKVPFEQVVALYDESPEKLKAISSLDARMLTYQNKVPFEQVVALYNESPEKLKAISSLDARMLTYQNKVPFEQVVALYNESPEKLKAISSLDARMLTYQNKVPFEQVVALYDEGKLKTQLYESELKTLLSEAVKVKKVGGNVEITTESPQKMQEIIKLMEKMKSVDTAIVPLGGSKLRIAIKNPTEELGRLLKTVVSQRNFQVSLGA